LPLLSVPEFCRIQSSAVVQSQAIRNERPREGYTKNNGLQFAVESTNQVVGGSNPSGRANFQWVLSGHMVYTLYRTHS